jgi:hypothetical protein
MTVADRLLLSAAAGIAVCDAYLLVLLAAATARRHERRPGANSDAPADRTRFIVLVPAHDEERTLPRLLASLDAADGSEATRVVVIADNCTDATPAVARDGGAEVLERRDPARPGKGPALAWALAELEPLDAPVVMVDADCQVSPNLFTALGARRRAGANVAQVEYVVANPEQSRAAALRAAAFLLVNSVRPAGRDALGVSAGLLGTGMMFTPEVLQRVPWRDFGLAEDAEYGLRLAAAGERVAFVPEARVVSPMPTTVAASRSQEMRWEAGKVAAARMWTPRLLAAAVERRDPRLVATALDVLVPPQAILGLAHAGIGALAVLARAPLALRLSLAGIAAQALYVVGGLLLVRAPRQVWVALLHAPRLVIGKAQIAVRLATGRGPSAWVRTEREEGPVRSTQEPEPR